MSFRLDVLQSFSPHANMRSLSNRSCNERSIHHAVILLKSAKFHDTGPCISARSFFFFVGVVSPSTSSSSADFLLADIGPHVNTVTCLHKMISLEMIRVYYHQCRCSAFLNWKIKRNLDKALTQPRRRKKNVGTKPESIIPGGKSVICILKLKSGTITEIP